MWTLLQCLCFLLLGSCIAVIWSKPSQSALTTQNMNNGTPQSCSAKVLNSSSVLLTWKPPFGNGSFWNDYWVFYRPLYSKGKFSKLDVGSELELTVNGLYSITYYAFRIVTKDSTGKQSFCEVLAKTARDARYYIPIQSYRENKTALAFTWRPVNLQGVLVTYRLYMECYLCDVPRVSLLYEGPETYFVIQSDKLLLPSRFYVSVTVGSLLQITMQAAYKPTYGTKTAFMPSGVGSTTTRPAHSAFINVTNDARGWKFVRLSWNPLTSDKNHVMYRLSYRSGSSFKEEVTSKTTALILGLQQLTKYTITVHAEHENGTHIFASTKVVVSTLDRNECTEIPDACPKPSECVNSRGSYFCRCPQGWTGDGKVCKEWPKKKVNVSFCDSLVYVNITWQKTLQGQTALALCPLGARGVARRQCLDPVPGDLPRWAIPDLSDCISDRMANIALQLEDPDVDLSSIAEQLVNATDIVPHAQGTLQAGDLKIVTDVMEKISQKSFGDLQGKVQTIAEAVVRTSSNILDSRTLELWKFMPKESMANEATKLLEGLDKIALHLAKSKILGQTIVSETPNVVLSVKSTNDTSPTDQRIPLSNMRNETLSSVVLPGSVFMLQRGKHKQNTVHYVTFVSYRNLKELMQPHVNLRSSVQTNRRKREDTIESEIVSVSISPMKKNVFDDPVTLILRNSQHPTEREAHCVFWNVSSPRVFWSKTGCKLVKQNSSHTVCQCYHLTSFAVLMRTTDIQEGPVMKNQSVLSLLSFIGISISIVALFICFLTFTFLRFRNVRLRYFVHANLAFSLCLAETLFLFGINKTQNQLVCKLIAVTLHYLFLVSFCWMALEGVVLYLLLVKIFHSKNRSSKDRAIFFLCGWGIPAVVVSVCAGFFLQGYGTEAFCWLSLERHFTWAFVAPVLLICLFNCICLGRIFIVMANSRRVSQDETRIQQIRYWSRGCALLSCLLGLTWILGVFVINEETIFMAYLFNIFNTLQGLLIFLFHCIGDEKVRAEYLRILCCQSRAKSHGVPRPWWSKSGSLSRSRTWEEKNGRTRRSTLQSTTEYAKTTAERMASRKVSNTADRRGATEQGSIDRPLEISMLYGITEDTHAQETNTAEVDVLRVNDSKNFTEQESDQPPTYEPVCDKELQTSTQRKKHSDGDSSQSRFPDVTHQGDTDAESTL